MTFLSVYSVPKVLFSFENPSEKIEFSTPSNNFAPHVKNTNMQRKFNHKKYYGYNGNNIF